MGEGEKVAQDGCDSELGPVQQWMLRRISFLEHRVAELEAGIPKRVEALEDLVEDLGGSVDTLQAQSGINQAVGPTYRPPCDCPNTRWVEEEMEKSGVNFSPGFNQIFTEEGARKYGLDPEKLRAGLEQVRKMAEAPAIPKRFVPVYNALRDLRYELSAAIPEKSTENLLEMIDTAEQSLDDAIKPCSPAPPPCAEPAEPISSGGESCGEGTAGGACCSWMAMAKKRHWATVGELSGCTFLCLYDGDDTVGPDHDEVISFCPNCGFPLREDGELKVGS
jgi:hypothetical protein